MDMVTAPQHVPTKADKAEANVAKIASNGNIFFVFIIKKSK